MPVGAVVLSEQANERGPALLNVVIMMMQEYGLQPDKEKLPDVGNRGEAPKLSVVETQELLDGDLRQIREQYNLSLEDGACACALTTAWLIKKCAPKIGVEVGFNIASYGFIEGSKTVPRPEGDAAKDKPKKPWYRLWK
jgi:hypothetical protein